MRTSYSAPEIRTIQSHEILERLGPVAAGSFGAVAGSGGPGPGFGTDTSRNTTSAP